MESLRTPEERFEDLPAYDFAPNYVEVPAGDGDALRMHFVDEGDGEVILLLHGEPSWSFLYRKMVPILCDADLRCVIPDFIGFGRSDKPADRRDYTYQRHVDWLRSFVTETDLRGITLVCQDWGGLLGLRLAAEEPDRFDRIVAANTFLPTGDQPLGEAFFRWRDYSQQVESFPAGWVVARGCVSDLPPEVVAAYDAPFPDDSYKEGARQFPTLVPATPDDPAALANRAAWEVLSRWHKPFLTAFSDSDPITRGADLFLQAAIPGCAGQPHTTIENAGHYLQEDRGEILASVIAGFVNG